MKKFLNELNNDELLKVLQKNEKLQNEVIEDMEDNEMHWISEYLDCFRNSLSDYSIGFNNYNYIKVRDERQFLEGVLEAQEKYCF